MCCMSRKARVYTYYHISCNTNQYHEKNKHHEESERRGCNSDPVNILVNESLGFR